jgi:hypothetical protein
MTTKLNETISAAEHGIESIKDAAENLVDSAMKRMSYVRESKASRAFSILLTGLNVAIGVGALMRFTDMNDMLRWAGLRRRRSLLPTLGVVGAGMVAGVGIAALLAPRAGQETRRTIREKLQAVGRKGREIIEEVASEQGSEQGEEERGGGNGGQTREGRAGERGPESRGESKGEGMPGGMKHTAGPTAPGSTTDQPRSPLVTPEGSPLNAPGPGREANKPLGMR